jgi:hypothetical protein
MSRRFRPPPDDEAEPEPEEVAVPPDDPEPDEDDDVEYFVEVSEAPPVLTSVPNSAQESQTSSSAPSILTAFGVEVSVPHISH